MEMTGEQIVKRGKKTARWILIGYAVCFIAIIGAIFSINYRQETQTPEPIDFTTDGTIGMATEQYAYLNVEGLTDEVAIFGDVENEYSSSNDRYYIALSGGYMYIVDLDFDTIDLLKPWQDYLFSEDENLEEPEPVTIYGMTEEMPQELKKFVLDYYNEGLSEEYQIREDQFENYFGSVLLNARRTPVDTSIEGLVIILGAFGIIMIAIIHIVIFTRKNKIKKDQCENDFEKQKEA